MSFSYATPTSGASAGGIGWFDFGNLTMNPGDFVSQLSGTLSDGSIVTFDLSMSLISGTPRSFSGTQLPTYPGAQFGTAGYTNIAGNAAMYSATVFFTTTISAFTISNISVVDAQNNPIPNYTVFIADPESTHLNEGIHGQTDAENWKLFTTLGINNPTLTGVGTTTFNIVGNQLVGYVAAYVLSTQNPNQITVTLDNLTTTNTRQGFSLGFATTQIKLQKYVAGRIDVADQFQLDIIGTPSDQAITTGLASGLQPQVAEIYSNLGTVFEINEIMAAGSLSTLGDYITTVSAVNATPAGSVPPIGTLPIFLTPVAGDNITYTIYNTIPYSYEKTVDKAYADIGEVLTYSVTIKNSNSFPVNNISFMDSTPLGTSYIGNLLVNVPFSGTDPANGLTITSISGNSFATISWQVLVNTAPPVSTPVVNIAHIDIPDGNSGVTNLVTTAIHTAYVTMIKTVDKAFAEPNDVVSYTLTLNNAGNVAAYNVVITDAIASGANLVAGSIIGATGTLPTLTLNAPLAAGGTATVSYKIKIGSTLPTINPIPNSATLAYSYTVDPAQPLGVTKTAQSNIVNTQVNEAKLLIEKSADKIISYIGNIITYNFAIKNIGNVSANNVILTDVLTAGTKYIAGSLVASVPFVGNPSTNIILTNSIAPNQTATISFKVSVTTMPNPNPILNIIDSTFNYTANPQNPNGETGSAKSNTVTIIVLRNNLVQQINDLIESVSLEQAALAAIANSEGAKIQRMSAMQNISTDKLLCLNKSVAEMLESIALLESVLKQKLDSVDCHITGSHC